MRKTYKYRVYPTRKQQRLLDQALEECRWVYNQTLALRRDAWQQEGRSLRLYDTQGYLPRWKEERPALQAVHSQVLQNVQVRVDLAFNAFFRRVRAGEKPGYPRFKSQGRYDSLTYPQYGNGARLEGSTLTLSKVGTLQVVLHRPVAGAIKTVTLRRTATGKWYACLSCEVAGRDPAPRPDTAVGVDVGLASFATLSNGEKVANPRFFRRDERALAKAQRRLAAVEKGTLERAQRRRVVGRIHERIANRRADFAHQTARGLVNRFGVVVFEDLNTHGLLQNHGLAKSIADAAWGQLVQYTVYKAEEAGRRIVLVDPRYTSQMCSRCGRLVAKDLSVRVHECPRCGLVLDRDQNAAINILRLGLQSLGESPRSPPL
jgi:putative transposase